ncbi:Hypothetical predicted protein, partial [Paramuricea clavata]
KKIEFLPKFVSGDAYETVKRMAGCSYPDIILILQHRYGQPATVAASCIESLTSGPKLTNDDYKGLRYQTTCLTNGETQGNPAYTTDFEKGKIDGTGDNDNDNKRKKSNWPNCPCCSRSHELAFCPKFRRKEVNARWDVVKKQKLCHVCMKAGHFRENCRYVEFCPCGSQRKHNLLLHNTKSNENKKEMKDEKKLSEDHKEVDPDKQSAQEKKTEQYATITNTTSKFVLLHVVPVKVLSPQGVSVTTFALLDNASRGTMISSELAKELNLRGRKETILVNTLLQQENVCKSFTCKLA